VTIFIEYASPLSPLPLDVRGNAQHWFIRTADAANDRTMPHWLARFNSQDAWESQVATPADRGWSGYLKDTGATRKGLPLAVVKRNYLDHFADSWRKAVLGWVHAFRDEGDRFFEQLTARTQAFEESTEDFLGDVGIHMRNFLGSFSTHIMLLCGNQAVYPFLAHRTQLTVLTFPDPPILMGAVRPVFNQEYMALLCRDFFLGLPLPPLDDINFLLDVTLEAYLTHGYAPPPVSFVHVEHTDGIYQMHTHIEGDLDFLPPIAFPLRVPMRQLVAPPGQVVLVPDLFAYGQAGTFPLATLFLQILEYTSNQEDVLLFLSRSDTMSLDVQLNSPVPTVVSVPAPPGGTRWQIVLRTGSLPPGGLAARLSGFLWFFDTALNESNHAEFLIAGAAPTALPFSRILSGTIDDTDIQIAWNDLFDRVIPGDNPVATCTIVLTAVLGNFDGYSLLIERSDSDAFEINLTSVVTVPQVLGLPPPGTRWLLLIDAHGTFGPMISITFVGRIWFTDSLGNESNHANWALIAQS
jgi:hypothetical protein